MAFTPLAVTTTTPRPAGPTLPTLAAAAFDTPAFMSGTMRLRPGSVKEADSTDASTLVLYVAACQPRAVQVSGGVEAC